MKKFYTLALLGVLSAISVTAQHTPPVARQPLEKRTLQLSSPLKDNMFSVQHPVPSDATLFQFDSLNVSYLGSWGFGQTFTIGSATYGNIVFVGSGAGVMIFDVTNPSSPVKLSEISARGLVDAVCYDEASNRLYLCAYFAGFEIWDVSDMSAPVRIGGGPTTGLPRGGIFAGGNYVYVVTVADGVQIYDISNPSSPVNTGNCPLSTTNFAWNSAKSGDLIFVAIGNGGLKVVNVSDPSNPFVAGTYSYQATGVTIANGYAYVAANNFGLRILDFSDLSNIAQVGYCTITGYPSRVQVSGNYAYISNPTSPGGGINVVDVSNPASPQPGTTYDGYAEYVTVTGSVLAYTGGTLPCTFLDITVPSSPSFASSYALPITTIDMEVNGNYAYTGNNGFRVFDITDKTHPLQAGYDPTDGAIVRLAGNNALYIRESMTANNPVMIMDVSEPTQPGFVGQYMAPVMTNDLEIRDHYAFVACWWDGFRVVDFQDPSNPMLVAHKEGWFQNAVPGEDFCYVQALDIDGNYLYLIDYGPFTNEDTRGLYIWDITDPVNPVFISRYTDFLSGGYDLDAAGNYVYLADMYGGVEVIDVTDKLLPVARGYALLPDGANAIKVTENQAFVANYINGGVQVVDVADPDNPVVDGYYTPSGCFALGVNVQGTNILLADGAGGFQIYNTTLVTAVDTRSRPTGIQAIASPNPFTDHVRITVGSNGNPDQNLHVYDALGRLDTILPPKQGSSGSTLYEWDGTTGSGLQSIPGFYYFNTSAGSASGKMVKVL